MQRRIIGISTNALKRHQNAGRSTSTPTIAIDKKSVNNHPRPTDN
jgi:hypothetical protein